MKPHLFATHAPPGANRDNTNGLKVEESGCDLCHGEVREFSEEKCAALCKFPYHEAGHSPSKSIGRAHR
jgi:hypothetical protein